MSASLTDISASGIRKAALRVVLGALTAFAVIAYAFLVAAEPDRRVPGDFLKFHLSARFLIAGEDIYQPVPISDYIDTDRNELAAGAREYLNSNLNPPFQTFVLAPLGILEYTPAFVIWSSLSLIAGIVGALILGGTKAEPGHRVIPALVWINLLLFYFPTAVSVSFGQWSLLPFALLVFAWVGWRRGNAALAGGILGALAAIKLFFGAFLLLFVARRQWRASLAFSAVWFVCTGVGVIIVGPESVGRFVSILREVDWHSASWNASFLGYFSRIFGVSVGDSLIHVPQLGLVLAYGLSALTVLWLFVMPRGSAGDARQVERDDLAFSVCIVIMLLVSPFGWMYYFPFLLVPFAVTWRTSYLFVEGRRLRLLMVTAWVLSAVPQAFVPAGRIPGDPLFVLGWAGLYFYSLVLLLSLIMTLQKRLQHLTLAV